MGGLGWHNPFPMQLGGGPTPTELVYAAMRGAVGVGGSAADDESIDGMWRQARASALAAAACTGERAAMQAFPGYATDLLEFYEVLLGATPEPDASIVERQAIVLDLFTRKVRAAVPDIDADLKAIDSRLGVVIVDPAEGTETLPGRGFQDLAAALPFNGGRKSSVFHNYSTSFVVFVLFDIGAGVAPGAAEQKLIERAKAHLNEVLPGHVMFQMFTSLGFILDESLLDLTGLRP